MIVERVGVYLISLDPTLGAEMKKTRPCVIISPDELNRHLRTVIVAPLTSSMRAYPFRVDTKVAGREGQLAIDQIRAIDKSRIVKRLGKPVAGTSAKT
jgi:mRNA interferase MazF